MRDESLSFLLKNFNLGIHVNVHIIQKNILEEIIMKKKFLTLLMSVVLVFTLVACGNNTGNTTNETNKETTKETIQETVKETTKEIETKAENTNQNLGLNGKTFEVELEEALKIFYDTFGDNTIEITSFQLEEESNGYDYEIEGFKDGIEYEIEIDANTGNCLLYTSDAADDSPPV